MDNMKKLSSKEYRLDFNEYAKKIVENLSLEEKVYFMSGNITIDEMIKALSEGKGNHYNYEPYHAGGNARLNIPDLRFVDGPRGAVTGVGKTTCFPVSMARGASFDKNLEYRVGEAIGKEVRATGGNYFGGVCVNLPYNPGWGRSQEVYGEDSFHLGAMGSQLSKGVQSKAVIACGKHYAFNSMENARFKVNVKASKRTEREVYLSHFKDLVDSGIASIMSAYNKYKDYYCGENDYLLNEVLKNEWDFDGFVVSDFIHGTHDTVNSANSGLDVEMNITKVYGDKLIEAVRKGEVKESVIDDQVTRIIRTLLACEDAYNGEYDKLELPNKEHIKLAKEVAEESITLIKNKNNILPIDKKNTKKILVIGELANKSNIGDYGSSRVYPAYVKTALQGLKEYNHNIEIIYDEGKDLEKLKEKAKESDYNIFIVGYDHDDEGEYVGGDFYQEEESGNFKFKDEETRDLVKNATAGGNFDAVGGDRKKSLGLHKDDIELINGVGPINKNSVVCLVGGNMIMIDEWKDSVSAILMTYYSGMEGGTALANILFGEVNPSGKLPFVIPHKEEDLPQVDWDADEIVYDYYHGYRKLEKEGKEPSVPYGFGLSYTQFNFSNPQFDIENDKIVTKVDVENVGDRAGKEVVQLYVGFDNSKIDRPVKTLMGFEKLELKPGDKKRVIVKCPIKKLKYYNEEKESFELEKMSYQIYIGNNSIYNLIKDEVKIN